MLRAEVQRAETLQAVHAATEAEFIALAALNLAIGLKCNQPIQVVEPPEASPSGSAWRIVLETAVRERREFGVVRSTVEIAVQGSRVARADFAPKVIADGTLFDFLQQHNDGRVDFRVGFIRLEWALFEGGRRIAATHVAEAQVRQAMAQAESIADQIAFQVNEAYRAAVTAWVGIADARQPSTKHARTTGSCSCDFEKERPPRRRSQTHRPPTRAEQNLLNARYNYLIAMDRLHYAMGVGNTPMTMASAHHYEGTLQATGTSTNEYNAGSPAASAPPTKPSTTTAGDNAECMPLVVAWLRPGRLVALAGTVIALIAIGLPAALSWIEFRRTHSITDDAFVEAHIVNVAPEIVSGRVIQFLADENDQVKQGQVIALIDPTPYRDKVNVAQTQLETARAELARQRRPGPRPQGSADPGRDRPADGSSRPCGSEKGRGITETDQ